MEEVPYWKQQMLDAQAKKEEYRNNKSKSGKRS